MKKRKQNRKNNIITCCWAASGKPIPESPACGSEDASRRSGYRGSHNINCHYWFDWHSGVPGWACQRVAQIVFLIRVRRILLLPCGLGFHRPIGLCRYNCLVKWRPVPPNRKRPSASSPISTPPRVNPPQRRADSRRTPDDSWWDKLSRPVLHAAEGGRRLPRLRRPLPRLLLLPPSRGTASRSPHFRSFQGLVDLVELWCRSMPESGRAAAACSANLSVSVW